MRRLRAQLYERAPQLNRDLDVLIQRLESAAADLDWIGHGDPNAPRVGAPTKEVLAYLFKQWPATAHEFRRLITRADQVLGRRAVLIIAQGCTADT
jgi:hypothetical protein